MWGVNVEALWKAEANPEMQAGPEKELDGPWDVGLARGCSEETPWP